MDRDDDVHERPVVDQPEQNVHVHHVEEQQNFHVHVDENQDDAEREEITNLVGNMKASIAAYVARLRGTGIAATTMQCVIN